MLKDLKILIKMQKCDDIIGEKDKLLQELPEELSSLKSDLADAKADLDAAKANLDENRKTQKLKELEIKDHKEKIAKYKNQLLTIKTNKEYKALNSEINHLETKNAAIDDEIIALMEKENALRKELDEIKKAHKAAADKLAANEEKLQKRIDEVDAEITALRSERNAYAKNLSRQLIKRYASLIKNKGRKAVVFNENNACSGCGFTLRPQLKIEIADGKKIINCENCGRILAPTPVDQ